MSEKNSPLTRRDLVDHLMIKLDLEKKEAAHFVEFFFEILSETLSKGESVHLSGFGNLDVMHKKTRMAQNPKTQEKCSVKARRVVSFHASPKLKKLLDSHH